MDRDQQKELIKEKMQKEAVASIAVVRQKKQLKEFERFIWPFFRFWDEDVDLLMHARDYVPKDEHRQLAELIKDFKTAGSRLSLFLRGHRLRMMKGK